MVHMYEQVNLSDQKMIQDLSVLAMRISSLNNMIKRKKNDLQLLDDLDSELILLEEEPLRYNIGEAFIMCSPEQYKAMLEDGRNTITREIGEIVDDKQTLEEKLKELKVVLYGKFGDEIRLD